MTKINKWKRSIRFFFQRLTRGWDDSETWSLDAEIARWTLPRLQRFRKLTNGFPANLESMEEWQKILEEIEWFLSIHASEDGTWQLITEPQRERYKKAEKLFGEYFSGLWW